MTAGRRRGVPWRSPEVWAQEFVAACADPEVTVILDRRQGERRQRRSPAAVAAQRVIRDRRRRRVNGDFAALHGEGSLISAA